MFHISCNDKQLMMGQARSVALAFGFFFLYSAFGQTSADPDCSGHGHKVDGSCVCDNPEPSQGQQGYAGEECDIRIFGVSLDGSDVTQTCSSSGCGALQPEDWVCFSSPLKWNDTAFPWNYLTIQLNRTSEDELGDPDLYGLFYGGSSGEGRQPLRTTYLYDFRETSSSSHSNVVKKIEKSTFADKDYAGVHLCIKAYGEKNLTFSLRATVTKCPGDFTSTGERMECSTPISASDKRYTGCNDDGTCSCKEPYAKPLEYTYEGLGFEDCSAKVVNVTDGQFAASHTFAAEHEEIAAKAWNFYAFNVSQEDYQVVINVAGESDSPDECTKFGYFGAFAKFGQPPGWRYGQWDFRPQWDLYQEQDNDLEIAFDQTMEGYQSGVWYVGVNGDDLAACKYTVTVSKYACPMNCTGQGECLTQSNGTRTCQCNQGFFGPDCSQQAAALVYSQQVSKAEAAFEYQYYQLPEVTPAMLTHPVEVRFSASFSSSNYGTWTAAKPELLLLKGDHTAHPTAGNYTFKVALEEQNTTYNLDLCPSQLKQGVWRAAIYNPMRIYQIAYNLTATKQGHCLNGCSSHGACTEDGVCQCTGNWAGGDCSVDTSATSCQQGTRKAAPRPEQRGTCWQECKCDGAAGCRFQDSCAEFTCDSPQLRRKGGASECVQDECTSDEWEETEAHSCLKQCNCPSDGTACSRSSSCKRENFSCKQGYKRFSNGDAKCYPTGCQSGALQEATVGAVDNGKAYGVCLCGTAADEREDTPLCKVPANNPEALSITCDDGYSLQGAVQQPSSSVWLGGKCVKSTGGTPAWGVVLWVFFSMLAGGASGIGLLWFYEHKLRTSAATDSLYHELSMDTGF